MATYTWTVQRSADSGSTWSDVTGGTFDQNPPFSVNVPYTLQPADSADDIRLKVVDPNGNVKYSVIEGPISPSAPPVTTTYKYDSVVPALTYPTFTPSRHIVCTTRSAHDSAVSGMLPGDWIDAQGITFSGEVRINPHLSAYGKITYDDYCIFNGTGASATNLPCIYLPSPTFLQLLFSAGTQFHNPNGNEAILAHGMQHCVLDGFVISDVGGSCLDLFPVAADGSDVAYNFIRGVISDFGKNLTWDPHTEKGTGYDGCHLGDGKTAYAHHNTVALYGHDCPVGNAVIEIGDSDLPNHDNVYYIKARHMTQEALIQVAGNGISAWGKSMSNESVVVLECYDCVGRAIDLNGMSSGVCGVTVEYGRADDCATNTHLTPYAGEAFDPRFSIVYKDKAENLGLLS